MMVALGGLEAIATLANIGGLAPGSDNSTDFVKKFMEKYFAAVNTRYGLASGNESMIALFWDAYRNGGLHRFFPKRDKIKATSGEVRLEFGISWPTLDGTGSTRCLSLDETRERWKSVLAGNRPESKHLCMEPNDDGSVNFWICAPYFALEFVDAVEKWSEDLRNNSTEQSWFVNGANGLPKLVYNSARRRMLETRPERIRSGSSVW